MRFDQTDKYVDAGPSADRRFLQHGIGLADAGRSAEKNLQPPAVIVIGAEKQGLG